MPKWPNESVRPPNPLKIHRHLRPTTRLCPVFVTEMSTNKINSEMIFLKKCLLKVKYAPVTCVIISDVLHEESFEFDSPLLNVKPIVIKF